jgi:hypothetical protein
VRAWRKQVTEKLLDKTFLMISLAYIALLTLWYLRLFSKS